ncbi:MAG: DUF2232 domain-containing protein [Spirochaetia bacterium]|jgi:hypothetical protein
MYKRSPGGQLLEILLFTLSSLVLYHTGVGIVLFLVPLQVVASRRGMRSLLAAAGIFLAVFLLIRFWPYFLSRGQTSPDVLVWLEMGMVALLLLGMVVINLPLQRRPRSLFMALAATAFAGIVAFPALLALSQSAAFQRSMDALFAEVAKTLSSIFAPAADGAAGSLVATLLEPARLRQLSEAVLLRSLLAGYAVLITFSWWAGQAAAARAPATFGVRPSFRFARFRLESWWLWPLIASGALILLDLFFGISAWAYAVWNIGIVLLFLYGLQGMAILWFLFDKYHLPRFLWLLLIVGFAILAASPSVGLFIILAVPLFGISENWIRYRIPREPAPKSEP